MANEIDYHAIFRAMSTAELSAAIARLNQEFADPYTAISAAGTSSQRDRAQIATELSAACQVHAERNASGTPRTRARAFFA
jgi:hypothetical protein